MVYCLLICSAGIVLGHILGVSHGLVSRAAVLDRSAGFET